MTQSAQWYKNTKNCFNDIIATILSFLYLREMYRRALPAWFDGLIMPCLFFDGQLLTRAKGLDMTYVSFLHKDFSHPEALSRKQLVTCFTHNSLSIVSKILNSWGHFKTKPLAIRVQMCCLCPDYVVSKKSTLLKSWHGIPWILYLTLSMFFPFGEMERIK